MNLQPLGDRLIVDVLDEEELTVSGIVLPDTARDRKSTRLNSSHDQISYAVFCLKKKKKSHPPAAHKLDIVHQQGALTLDNYNSLAPPPRHSLSGCGGRQYTLKLRSRPDLHHTSP